ncbi:MAG TPA: dienelactone hydrolase family protein [Opitutaceae bacterium]|nr:dienelactone hydrolase family protein [Opitutaceae bacterium]
MPDAGEPAATKKSPAYRIGATVLSVAVIVFIFLAVIPQLANYRDAWAAIAKMSLGWWVAIAAAAVINLGAGVWGFQAALPRLRFRHGFMEMQASTAVATTVPAGGALALGLTYRMFGSFGFSNVAISTAVVTTGVWNLGTKFGLPIAAVALLAVTGQRTGGMPRLEQALTALGVDHDVKVYPGAGHGFLNEPDPADATPLLVFLAKISGTRFTSRQPGTRAAASPPSSAST